MNEKAAEQPAAPPLVKLITQEFMQDPYPDLAAYRETGSAVAVENGGFRMWLVCGYDEARSLLADPATKRDVIKNRDQLIEQTLVRPERKPHIPRALRVGMIDRDGEDHRRLRGVISRHFTAARVAERRERVELVADRLLRGIETDGPVDLIERLCLPLAATIVEDLLGLAPGAEPEFPNWVNDMLTGDSPEAAEAGAGNLLGFTRRIIDAARATPGDDMTHELIAAAEDGVLEEIELESTVALLLIAGMEPASTLGSAIYTLLTHPEELAALRADPRLLAGCVEEAIRFEGPFRMLPPRYREEPYRVGDVTIPAGEFILISSAAASRDPRRYPDPERFDIRRDARGHLGFSHGVHRCLGAELGRLEVTAGLERLLAHFSEISLAVPPEQARWRPGTFMRRLYRLPVTLGRAEQK